MTTTRAARAAMFLVDQSTGVARVIRERGMASDKAIRETIARAAGTSRHFEAEIVACNGLSRKVEAGNTEVSQ